MKLIRSKCSERNTGLTVTSKNDEYMLFRFKQKQIYILLGLFCLLRIIYVYSLGWKEIPHGDGLSYNSYALAILNQPDLLFNPSFYGDYREPVYPLFIALIYFFFGENNLFAVFVFQAFINTLTVYYIYKFSSMIFDSSTSLLALIWAGFYFYYFLYAGYLLRETLIFFLLLYSFYQLLVFFKRSKRSGMFVQPAFWKHIVSFVLLFHTDSRYLFYLFFFPVAFIVYFSWRNGIKRYCVAIIGMALLCLPWIVRNYAAYKGFVFINTRTLDMRQEMPFFRFDRLLGVKKKEGAVRLINKQYPNEEERQQIKQGVRPPHRTDEEIKAIRNDIYAPHGILQRLWFNFKIFWAPMRFTSEYRPWPDCRFLPKYSLWENIIKGLSYGVLLPFMVVGGIDLLRRKNKDCIMLLLPPFVQMILHLILWAWGRYRNPIDAFIIVMGCYGIVLSTRVLHHIRSSLSASRI